LTLQEWDKIQTDFVTMCPAGEQTLVQ
jgi:hypothetical protein